MRRETRGGAPPRIVTLLLKVQRPSLPPDAPWLVYDRMRRINLMIPAADISSSVKRALGDDHRGFFTAIQQDDGRIIFGRREPDPGW